MRVSSAVERLRRLPAERPSNTSALLWAVVLGALAVGLVCWGTRTLQGGFIALWCFVVAAIALALVLPLPYALVSPLFMGLFGWLVDMLPFLILAGWSAAVVRWLGRLVDERRLPQVGRWLWLPAGLVVWTALGGAVVARDDFRHFLLLLGIQGLISATVVAVADSCDGDESRSRIASGLLAFVVVLSVAVFLQWIGVPLEPLQNTEIADRAEEAYGVDAFPNNIGMVKYARARSSGAGDLRSKIEKVDRNVQGLPDFEVFRPKFKTFPEYLVVRFQGSATDYADALSPLGVELIYDNVALGPAHTVPRMRSFPRNALTYSGVCAALFPLALFVAWSEGERRRRFGLLAVAATLFGAAFALARGAWVAIALGIAYLFIDGLVSQRQKIYAVVGVVVGAVVLSVVFLVKYDADPLSARAGGAASIATRSSLYEDTVDSLVGIHLALGYGTERPRDVEPAVAKFVPSAGTHSTYLNYLFRAGLPGALGIIALYVIAGLHTRAQARERAGYGSVFATMLATAIVIAGAHAVVLSLYVEPVYTLTIALLLGLGMAGATALNRSVLPWRTARANPFSSHRSLH